MFVRRCSGLSVVFFEILVFLFRFLLYVMCVFLFRGAKKNSITHFFSVIWRNMRTFCCLSTPELVLPYQFAASLIFNEYGK